jgi:Uma2 family endonuclease
MTKRAERDSIEKCQINALRLKPMRGMWTVSTYEEYYSIEERVEIIDGTIYDMGSPTANHQTVTY